MNRDVFLARVRDAARSGRRFPVHVRHDLTREMGRADMGADLIERYVREIAAVGGRPVVVADAAAARDEVSRLLRQYEPRVALCWRHPTLDAIGIDDVLHSSGIEAIDHDTLVTLSRESQRVKILSAEIGITGVSCAVAETGSLMMMHGPSQERVASLTPPVHIAVVDRSRLVADLFDAFEQLAERPLADLPSNVTFITGPSKTGDIEMKLITGVHGPGKFHVVMMSG